MNKQRYLTAGEAAALAVVVLALTLWTLWPKNSGGVAVVTRGGEELGRYALDRPLRLPVEGANGFSLVVVVEDGQAHVENSTCPDLICQHHAPIARTGECIVCLPGQVVITVEGGESHGPDAVSG